MDSNAVCDSLLAGSAFIIWGIRMTEEEYLQACKKSKIYQRLNEYDRRIYLGMGLGEEASEVQGIIKKNTFYPDYDLNKRHLKEELGDTLHYLTLMIDEYGWTLSDIRKENADKVLVRNKLNR